MADCVHLKCKLNRTLICKRDNKPTCYNRCSNCIYKEFKQETPRVPLKKASLRLTKAQKERFSIFNQPLNKCAVCGFKMGVQLNEVFEGAKRGVSMANGFVIPLCHNHHTQFHNDRAFAIQIKERYQREFEKTHTHEEFMNLIHHNYL